MSAERPLDRHLTPDEVYRFIEKTFPSKQLQEIEDHLDACTDCVEYLATVVRSARPPTREEEEALGRITSTTPEEMLERLRPDIVASTPGGGRPKGSSWAWGKWVPAAATVAVILVAFTWLQNTILKPAQGRRMATAAIESLVSLRQGTGRVPLRYIPDFQRARVTRSGFDTAHPSEVSIEEHLRQAVALAPDELDTNLALGLFLLDKGALDEAEERLQKAKETAPDSILAINGLAVVLYERAIRDASRSHDLLRKGLVLLREARRKSPDDLQIAFNLAMFYQESGSNKVAEEYWTDYLEMDPDSEWADVAAEKLEDLSLP
jgi:cytochrome c-type biogenesis protein CcmH/NrfG